MYDFIIGSPTAVRLGQVLSQIDIWNITTIPPDENEDDLRPLALHIFKYVQRLTNAKEKTVRQRACELLREVFYSIRMFTSRRMRSKP